MVKLELPDELVERAAKALEQASGPAGYRVTDELWERYVEVTPDKVERIRCWARAVLEAALSEDGFVVDTMKKWGAWKDAEPMERGSYLIIGPLDSKE